MIWLNDPSLPRSFPLEAAEAEQQPQFARKAEDGGLNHYLCYSPFSPQKRVEKDLSSGETKKESLFMKKFSANAKSLR